MKATVLALALLAAGAAFAQSPPAAHEGRQMEKIATLLDLNETQKAQVGAILQEEHQKMKDAFAQAKASGTKPDFQQMRALHQQIHQETIQKLTPVLSASQMQKYQIIEHMGGRRHFGHGGPPADAPAQNQN
jgi:hypothetical protein